MRFLRFGPPLAILTLVLVNALGGIASAQDASVLGSPTGAGSPFAIKRCSVLSRVGAFTEADVTVLNRTKHELLTAEIVLRFFDGENAMIGETRTGLPLGAPVVSNDTTVSSVNISFLVSLTEPTSAVKRIDCRPAAATFSGNRKWAFGSRWPEKLLPLPKQPKAAARFPKRDATASREIVNARLAKVDPTTPSPTPPSDVV